MFNMKTAQNSRLQLNSQEERLVNAMNALGDTSRFKIFLLLLAGKELCVSEIADRIDISTPAVSQHFRIFELVGLVDKQRNGQKVCYKLKADDPIVNKLIALSSSTDKKGGTT